MHGDAAFAGQGIWAETLNLADLEAYTVGGTIHIIVNNLIGFTTPPGQQQSSRYASDIAKRQSVPIFHVNAEDPDAVVRVGKIAAEYRAKFGSDVVVDIIGYRRHGHSEVDDPTITQPRLYELIKNRQPLWKIYAQQTGIDPTPTVETVRAEYEGEQTKAHELTKQPNLRKLPNYWEPYHRGKFKEEYEVETAYRAKSWRKSAPSWCARPKVFHSHPKSRNCWSSARKWAAANARWIMVTRKRWPLARCCVAARPFAFPDRTRSAARSTNATPC